MILGADPGHLGAAALASDRVVRWWCWQTHRPTRAYPSGRIECMRSDGELLALLGPAPLGRYIAADLPPGTRAVVEGVFVPHAHKRPADLVTLGRWAGAFEAAFPFGVLSPTYPVWSKAYGLAGRSKSEADRKIIQWAQRQTWVVEPWGRLGDTKRAIEMTIALAEAAAMAAWAVTR